MPIKEDNDEPGPQPRLSADSSDDESPQPARVGWVYALRKDELVKELEKFKLRTDGTMPILRRRIVTFLREGFSKEMAPESPPNSIPETVSSQQPPSPIPTTSRVEVPEARPPSATAQPSGIPPPCRQPFMAPFMPAGRPSTAPLFVPLQGTPAVHPTVPQYSVADTCERVRKWKISFDGKTDPVEFLEKLCDFQAHSGIPSSLLLPALCQVFQGSALDWYRNYRSLWTEWNDFLSDFKQFYLPVDYQPNIEDEIFNRRQQPGEAGRDYVIAMQTLIRRHGGFSPDKILHRLYGNMLPEYRQYIRRTDIQSPRDLVIRIDEFESLRRELKTGKDISTKAPTNPENPRRPPEKSPPNRYRPSPAVYALEPRQSAGTSGNRVAVKTENRSNSATSARHFASNNICWRCGETGHFRSQCRGPARLFCSRCGRNGTMSRDCDCPIQGNRTTQREPYMPREFRGNQREPTAEANRSHQANRGYQGN